MKIDKSFTFGSTVTLRAPHIQAMKPFRPMRPKIALNRDGLRDLLPVLAASNFVFQVKLNDERGVMTQDGKLFNRHGGALDPGKAAVFAPAIAELRRALPDEPLDLALLGFRTGGPWKGCVVLLDRPKQSDWGYEVRTAVSAVERWDVFSYRPPPLVSRLPIYQSEQALSAFDKAVVRPGMEGLIGRAADRPYEFGDSAWMLKVKKLV